MSRIDSPAPLREINVANRDFLRALGAVTVAAELLRAAADRVSVSAVDEGPEQESAVAWLRGSAALLDHVDRAKAAIRHARFTGTAAEHLTFRAADGTEIVADARHLDAVTARLARHQVRAMTLGLSDEQRVT